MAEGRVFLVGAGPGDPGLVTLRAVQVLARADVVVHDRLVHPAVLAMAAPEAERIAAGKGPGGGVAQPAIHRLMVDRARRGQRVVRLKGGDPFLFGRGGEEALALEAEGIPWEVVPGVSSAMAAAAAARVPLTHRGQSAAVVITTGHTAGDGTVDWGPLAAVGGTLVVLMAMQRIGEVAEGLMGGGLAADTPAAAIHWATWPQEATVRASLGSLGAACRTAGLGPPGVLFVGPTAALLPQP